MKRIYFYIRSYFGFSQKEARGFVLLLGILLIFILLPLLTNLLPNPSSSLEDQRKLDSLTVLLNNAPIVTPKYSKVPSSSKPYILVPFNPNTSDQKQLESLGIPTKVALRIINYRNKGGSFKRKVDLSKMYGLDVKKYRELEPYIQLPDSIPSKKYMLKVHPHKVVHFDINTCDSTDLDKLKGIGPVLSSRIVKYRNRLGGFWHIDQYREVYGLDSAALTQLATHTFVSGTFAPKKLGINTSSKELLASHPYIGKKNATLIVNYRLQHGSFKSVDDLKEIQALRTIDVEKMTNYLDLN